MCKCKGSWTPPNVRDIALDTFINAVENEIMTSKPATIHNNLSMKNAKLSQNSGNVQIWSSNPLITALDCYNELLLVC